MHGKAKQRLTCIPILYFDLNELMARKETQLYGMVDRISLAGKVTNIKENY